MLIHIFKQFYAIMIIFLTSVCLNLYIDSVLFFKRRFRAFLSVTIFQCRALWKMHQRFLPKPPISPSPHVLLNTQKKMWKTSSNSISLEQTKISAELFKSSPLASSKYFSCQLKLAIAMRLKLNQAVLPSWHLLVLPRQM